MPVPLDEFPFHQTSLSMRHVGTSDRNFYDRCYFNAHDRTGDLLFVSGLGVYPNLGVIDAYALVRRGDTQRVLRCSDALGDDRRRTEVGPYRLDVLEPLQRVRLRCDGDAHGLAFDLTWEGSFPAVDEARHLMHVGGRPIIDTSRFAQVGTWSGTLRVDGAEVTVDPATWVGTRDRSWGIRPVGEAEPPGRAGAEPPEGFWWLYVPLRFEDFALVLIVAEAPDGTRTLNDASRVWPDGRVEQLGWPEVDIRYAPGTRHPVAATLAMVGRDRRPVVVTVETLGFVALAAGAGYGADPDWSHGRWMGRGWVDGAVYDYRDPAVAARVPYGVLDHVARATCDGAPGWGLFEHASIGRHDPSGFADYGSVAP